MCLLKYYVADFMSYVFKSRFQNLSVVSKDKIFACVPDVVGQLCNDLRQEPKKNTKKKPLKKDGQNSETTESNIKGNFRNYNFKELFLRI